MTYSAQEDTIVTLASSVARNLGKTWDIRLEQILRFCIRNPERFPNKRSNIVTKTGDSYQFEPSNFQSYLTPYVTGYYRELEGDIGLRETATMPDPAVDEVLKVFSGINPADLPTITTHHRISMAAENLIGKLLERYIASVLE